VRHVFVETNWVVGYAAPEYRQLPEARRLFDRATAGELRLHLPSFCLTEARETIRRKYQPRGEADALRNYVAWARANGRTNDADADTVRRALDGFETKVRGELASLVSTLDSLRRRADAVDVFALDQATLERAIELGTSDMTLEPYDQAVLAAVLVRGTRLRERGESDVSFCELDGNLQPWDKLGNAKRPLTQLYDDAGVWVYGDFELESPERLVDWP
jgi:predicted nucleic acid-binding protein